MSTEKLQDEIIDVRGMHCNSCVKLIENKLSKLKGIEKVKTNLAEEKVFFKFDPKKITLNRIKEEIVNIGYVVNGRNKKSTKAGMSAGKKNSNLIQGIIYGLIPHMGCIAFIIATILGTTVAIEFFKPLLMNPYFFYILIAISFIFATVSSFFYLKKQGFITFKQGGDGMEMSFLKDTLRRKWKYLSTMYGTTIFINLFLFFIVFPALANVNPIGSINSPSKTASLIAVGDSLPTITLKVAIPCPGHAPLISGELKKISGVESVKFRFPNLFDVTYDSSTVSEDTILSLDVFDRYKPTVLDSTDSTSEQGGTQTSGDAVDSVDGSVVGCDCGQGSGGGCCGCGAV